MSMMVNSSRFALMAGLALTLQGTAAGSGATQGDLSVAAALAGAAAGSGATQGDLSVAAALAGTAAGSGATQGALTTGVDLAGTAAGSGATQGALTTGVDLAGTAAGSGATQGDLSSVGTTYLGQVANRSYAVPNALDATNKQQMVRTWHRAYDDITSLQLVEANYYIGGIGTSYAELATGAAATIEASVEYPVGTRTRVLWSGVNQGSVPDNGLLVSDTTTIVIPRGAVFYIWRYKTSTVALPLSDNLDSGQFFDPTRGDGLQYAASGVTNAVMTGTITNTLSAAPYKMSWPAAIIAQTNRPAIFACGDSRVSGVGDTTNPTGNVGEIGSTVGEECAYINAGRGGDRVGYANASYTNRLALSQYCSHVVSNYGINDVRDAVSLATLQSRLQTFWAKFAGKPVWHNTMTPQVSTTDAYATLANQTPHATDAVRISTNDWLRTTPSGLTGYFDVADAVESTRNSGKWVVSGSANYVTSDGLHANRTGCILAETSAAIRLNGLVRAGQTHLSDAIANRAKLPTPAAASFYRRAAGVRHLYDLSITRAAVSLAADPAMAVTDLTGTTMDYSWSAGQVTLANSATATAEAIAYAFPLEPFATIEADVSVQSSANASIELRKDTNTRFIFSFTRFGTITTEGWVGGVSQGVTTLTGVPPAAPYTIRIQCQGRSALVWYVKSGVTSYAGRVEFASWDFRDPAVLAGWGVYLNSRSTVASQLTVTRLVSVLSGCGQADPRVVAYEDGTPIQYGGYVWLLMTTRGAEIRDSYQGIYRYQPVTGDLVMTGAIFGDRGDGIVRNDNAGHLMFDRIAGKWRLMLAGHSDHPGSRTLYGATFATDPRAAVSTISVAVVDMPGQPTTLYEDVYPIWDRVSGKWVATASKDASISVRMEADAFMGPYTQTASGGTNETGNLIMEAGASRYILAGTATSAFQARAFADLTAGATLTLDQDTGGNRVWPVVFPYVDGDVTRLRMLSFDRSLVTAGSSYSYGALYEYTEGNAVLAGVGAGTGSTTGDLTSAASPDLAGAAAGTGAAAGDLTSTGSATLESWLGAARIGDFDARYGVTQSAGATSDWTSQASGGYTISQATAGAKPTWSATGWDGTLPAITGDGVNDILNGALATAPLGSYWWFFVTERGTQTTDTSTGNRPLMSSRISSAGAEITITVNRIGVDAAQTNLHTAGLGTGAVSSVIAGLTIGKHLAFSQVTSTNMRTRIDEGAEGVQGQVGADAQTPNFSLFGDQRVAARRYAGKFGRVLGVNPAALPGGGTVAEREKIAAALMWEWGIQANLPTGHTYKTTAPTF